ncbi:hypothetical protein EAG18_14465 [Pseudoalteromonas sp. J010]|uniref:hypothetical protein n=1 Tax=Pseudoalteromonas sp. J010 TaxID=998465 RepID=UPI000F648094|nr:hypothetical protein [Pseudoalteromonas sp. J010]RRS07889.1 hypothetical protein EAG18_14465 [Pseudoalteromonas sp. J010]
MPNSQPGTVLSNAQIRAAALTTTNTNEVPATKQFAVNATGNLFIASTLNSTAGGSVLPQEAESAFGEVSVFFAALTKAMAQAGTSLYDYDALNKLVSSSGLFVKVTESNIEFESKQSGVTLSGQLIQTLLGLSGNLASIGKSLMDMIAGMGQASVSISANSDSQDKKVGTIIFVCEYLLGAISISPIIISANASDVKSIWQAGPCLKGGHTEIQLTLCKSVYLFVPPAFVKQAASLNEAMSDPEFNNLIESMRSVIAPPSKSAPVDNAAKKGN